MFARSGSEAEEKCSQMSSVSQFEASAATTEVGQTPLSRRLLATGVIAALLAALFFNFFYRQVQHALDKPSDWGHTLVIPLIALYFVYLQRERLAATPLRTTYLGLVPIFLGVAWYMLCSFGPRAIIHHNLQGAGVGLTLFGVLLLCFGWRAMRYLLLPLIYFVLLGVTISDRFMTEVTHKLQDWAAKGAHVLLTIGRVDNDLTGNVITIWNGGQSYPLNIAEACSGMRMVIAFLALGVLLAVTSLRHHWQRILLVLMAVPTALFVNVLRVITLALLTFIDKDLAAGNFHEMIGLLWLVPALGIYLGIIWVLQRLVIEDESTTEKPATLSVQEFIAGLRFDRSIRTGVIVVVIALVSSAVVFRGTVWALNIHLTKEAVPLERRLGLIPRELGRWQAVGEDQLLDEAIVAELGTQQYLNRAYAINGDPNRGVLQVHITYYTGMIDAVPHVPERCWTAGGLIAVGQETIPLALDDSRFREDDGPPNKATGRPYRQVSVIDPITRRGRFVRLPVDDLSLRVWEFQHGRSADQRLRQFAGYFFLANGRATPNPQLVRAWAFDNSTRHAYYAKIEFAAAGRDLTRDEFMASATDLLEHLLPEVMRCLPDWAEVEAGRYPVRAGSMNAIPEN